MAVLVHFFAGVNNSNVSQSKHHAGYAVEHGIATVEWQRFREA
jgi:hypothetical protein